MFQKKEKSLKGDIRRVVKQGLADQGQIWKVNLGLESNGVKNREGHQGCGSGGTGVEMETGESKTVREVKAKCQEVGMFVKRGVKASFVSGGS